MDSNHIKRRGLMLIFSSPSGAGKTSIARRLLGQDSNLSMSVSVTTRTPRQEEVEGKDYMFISEDRYHALKEHNELLEYAQVFNHYYGTPRSFVENCLAQGRDVIFDLDWQGTQQLRQNMPADVVSVFVLPPSWKTLEERLHKRAQDSLEVIHNRMLQAENEISHWPEYDYVILNHDLDASVEKAQSILNSERLRRERQVGLTDFVTNLLVNKI